MIKVISPKKTVKSPTFYAIYSRPYPHEQIVTLERIHFWTFLNLLCVQLFIWDHSYQLWPSWRLSRTWFVLSGLALDIVAFALISFWVLIKTYLIISTRTHLRSRITTRCGGLSPLCSSILDSLTFFQTSLSSSFSEADLRAWSVSGKSLASILPVESELTSLVHT